MPQLGYSENNREGGRYSTICILTSNTFICCHCPGFDVFFFLLLAFLVSWRMRKLTDSYSNFDSFVLKNMWLFAGCANVYCCCHHICGKLTNKIGYLRNRYNNKRISTDLLVTISLILRVLLSSAAHYIV